MISKDIEIRKLENRTILEILSKLVFKQQNKPRIGGINPMNGINGIMDRLSIVPKLKSRSGL